MNEDTRQQALGAPIEPATDDAKDGSSQKLRIGTMGKGKDKGRQHYGHPRFHAQAEMGTEKLITFSVLNDYKCANKAS